MIIKSGKSYGNMKHIVFFCEGQLGDLLILTPAIRAVKETYPSSRITTIILQRRRYDGSDSRKTIWYSAADCGTSSVMSGNPNVDQVIEIDRFFLRSLTGWNRLKAELKIILHLHRLKPDVILCTFPEDRFVIWGYFSGAGVRIGEARQKLSWLLTHKPDISKEELGVRDYYLGLVASIGAKTDNIGTEFLVSVEALAWADKKISMLPDNNTGGLVAVHPGASGPYKVWPPEYYARLIDHLQKDFGFRVLLCGTEFDREIIEAVEAQLESRIFRIKFDQDISKLAAIIARCRLCITNDSGPRHLAVAVGTPSMAFMMKDQDRQWKIYDDPANSVVLAGDEDCPVCNNGPCKNIIPDGYHFGSYCLRSVTVERAINQAKIFLNI